MSAKFSRCSCITTIAHWTIKGNHLRGRRSRPGWGAAWLAASAAVTVLTTTKLAAAIATVTAAVAAALPTTALAVTTATTRAIWRRPVPRNVRLTALLCAVHASYLFLAERTRSEVFRILRQAMRFAHVWARVPAARAEYVGEFKRVLARLPGVRDLCEVQAQHSQQLQSGRGVAGQSDDKLPGDPALV